MDRPDTPIQAEQAELAQLRRENTVLKQERDFLKRAAADSTGQCTTTWFRPRWRTSRLGGRLVMAQVGRPGMTETQKDEVWRLWRTGESLSDIGRAVGKFPVPIFGLVRRGQRVGEHRVARLMRQDGIRVKTVKKRVPRRTRRTTCPWWQTRFNASSQCRSPTGCGQAISRTSGPRRAGCMWPCCGICTRARWSVGRWAST